MNENLTIFFFLHLVVLMCSAWKGNFVFYGGNRNKDQSFRVDFLINKLFFWNPIKKLQILLSTGVILNHSGLGVQYYYCKCTCSTKDKGDEMTNDFYEELE
jgi:hypothetical protein